MATKLHGAFAFAQRKRRAWLALFVFAFLDPGTAAPRPVPLVDTVAFMLWGLEEDAKTKRMSEGVWETEDHTGNRSSVNIVRITDCLFRISGQVQRISMGHVLDVDSVLDFALVHDYSAWFANDIDRRIIVKIEGRGWYSKTVRSRATGRVVYAISEGNIDAYVADGGSVARLQNTFRHFRSAFCRGRKP
jgi:hypothetical protein